MFPRLRLNQPWSYRVRAALLDARADDQFIAAFPRSGSTWLRTMLTDVLVPGAEGNPDVFNHRIPGMTFRNMRDLRARPSPRLLMTHSPWIPALGRVVYVVRDGRSSVVSLYHYTTTRLGRHRPFEDFFEGYLAGEHGVPWHQHVEGWMGDGARRLGNDLQIVRYEEMRRDPVAVLADVLAFLGIQADPDLAEYAAQRANLKNARQIELSRRGHIATEDASFYRGGGNHDESSPLRGALLAQFEIMSRRALSLAGYA